MTISFIIFAVFVLAMLMAAITDATTMTIPNWISVMLFVSFLAVSPFVMSSWSMFGEHLLVGTTVFLFGFAMFAGGWFGGGDAKLMAATSFWWQWTDLGFYLVWSVFAGGILAMIILFSRKYLPVTVLGADWVYKLVKLNDDMPYGLALAFGGIFTLLNSEIFKAAVLLS